MRPEQLRAWRADQHLSLEQLAVLVGVPSNTLWRWEQGRVAIRHPRMLELALRAIELSLRLTELNRPAGVSSQPPDQ